MSDIQIINPKRNSITKKCSKKNLKVDLTPMVDLGFLLITFFILTTSMTKPTVTKLVMPKYDINVDSMKIVETGAINLLTGRNNNLFYYAGKNISELRACTYSEIRKLILSQKTKVASTDLFVSIKPSDSSTYKNVLDILDEMSIDDVKRYAIVNMNPEEKIAINKIENSY